MTEWLVVAGIVLAAGSGVPGIFLGRAATGGERIAAVMMGLAGGCGIAGVGLSFAGLATGLDLGWSVPGGAFALNVDGIAAMFLLQIFLVAPLGAVYGLGYWKQAEHPRDGRKLRLFYGLVTSAMALLVASRNTMLFLAGWEVMALAAFLLLSAQDDHEAARKVSYVYIVATRLGTLCLFAVFGLLAAGSGTFDFAPLRPGTPPGIATAIFLLTLVGCGLKAGVMPMHVWLPGAHAEAPSHVSALMSGVLIKMGIYGLVRVTSLFPHPPAWWGIAVLVLGAVSGVLGVAFAIGQHDLKRLLAYHSVENIGIICLGLGLALLGRSLGRGELVTLGLAGALLHVWNHGLFKGLLFLSAGSVLHATGTREIDLLGGLSKRMPWTAAAFLVGAVAICGLPPLNGFVSELLIYLGLFRSASLPGGVLWLTGALVAPALALIGGLALACFVKAYGAVFLGEARTDRTAHAHEASRWMLVPMGVLASLCALIGLFPVLVAPVVSQAVRDFAPEWRSTGATLKTLAPFGVVSILAISLALSVVAAALFFRSRVSPPAPAVSNTPRVGTWDCGYAAPSATMQYTSSSFAQILVGMLAPALRPQVHLPKVSGVFPGAASFHSHVPEVVLDNLIVPVTRLGNRLADRLKYLQHGSMNVYLLYILLTLLVLFLWRT